MGPGIEVTQTPAPAAAPVFNSEPAAIFWLVWAGVWTALLLCGMKFLYTNRTISFLRIRGLALSFGAIVMLHLYWLSVQIGLSVGQFVPNGVEFWVMSLYLPFGIALFHASNSQFLHVAKTQRRYADAPPNLSKPDSNTCNRRDKTALGRFRKLGYTNKMLTVVCTGMLIQASDVGSSSEPCWTIADIWIISSSSLSPCI